MKKSKRSNHIEHHIYRGNNFFSVFGFGFGFSSFSQFFFSYPSYIEFKEEERVDLEDGENLRCFKWWIDGPIIFFFIFFFFATFDWISGSKSTNSFNWIKLEKKFFFRFFLFFVLFTTIIDWLPFSTHSLLIVQRSMIIYIRWIARKQNQKKTEPKKILQQFSICVVNVNKRFFVFSLPYRATPKYLNFDLNRMCRFKIIHFYVLFNVWWWWWWWFEHLFIHMNSTIFMFNFSFWTFWFSSTVSVYEISICIKFVCLFVKFFLK